MEPPGNPSVSSSSSDMWDAVIDAKTADCEPCPGPEPPEFLLPPPPRPPTLQIADSFFCTDDSSSIMTTMETCDALPIIDASFRTSPSSQTLAVIILCSILLGLLVFIIAIMLVWKYNKRVQNFLPCKNSPQNNCDGATTTTTTTNNIINTGLYEDLNEINHHRISTTTNLHHHHHHHHHHQLTSGHIVAPSIEMIDVKNNIHFPSGYPISQHPPVFLCSSPGPDPYCSQDLYNPVYEELSDNDDDDDDDDTDLENGHHHHHGDDNNLDDGGHHHHSEDEFAEDELSLTGEIMMIDHHHHRNNSRRMEIAPLPPPPPPYRCSGSIPKFRRPHEPLPPLPPNTKRNRSLDRHHHQQQQEFHEGMLLDALLQLYPRNHHVVDENSSNNHHLHPNNNNSRRQIPSIAQRIPESTTSATSSNSSPYEIVPSSAAAAVIGHHLASFRPQIPKLLYSSSAQDSALGSDSGYSNHTIMSASGTTISRGSFKKRARNNNLNNTKRLSQISADLALT